MSDRPASEIIQSLRATLRKQEEEFASTENEPRIAELKRTILLRLANVEFVGATVEKANGELEHPDSALFAAIEEDP